MIKVISTVLAFLTLTCFAIVSFAQAPAKKEEAKPAVVCVEKDKNGKAILDAKTNKPVVCPKKDEKKEPAKK